MKVTIIYFRESGKFYSTGEYSTQKTAFHHVVKEIEDMFREGCNPGLDRNLRNKIRLDAVVEAFGVPFLIKASDSLSRLIVE